MCKDLLFIYVYVCACGYLGRPEELLGLGDEASAF